jgi:2-polyprenyl-6-methoxyphenol hydroxylase-like FAD-dependent oxidoreductase
MTQLDTGRTRVLIVGAGPVGLALAIELGQRGIACLVCERNDRVGYAPRAKTTNVRTREHLRRWGIADQLAAASPFGVDYPSNIVFITRLAGYPLARFENAFNCAPATSSLYSEHAQWIPQYALEEVLRAHAQTLPAVEIHFSAEMVAVEQSGDYVQAEIRDLASGAVHVVRADYLVGADGARSAVRDAIGARMEGVRNLSRNYNIVFRAPGLAQAHAHGPAIMYWQINADSPSVLGPMDRDDIWFFMPTDVPVGTTLDNDAAVAKIRQATGIDLPYEILSSDQWFASRLLADRYRDRRIFLAGDACHLHPPFGGYGMNMGVADGVDLGWKLAATLQAWGGPTLLDSYEAERRPVHNYVMDEAVANHALLGKQLWQEGIEDAGEAGERARAEIGSRIRAAKAREFSNLGVVLGYSYEASPIVASDGSAPPVKHHASYVPSAHPGCLAPHAWHADGRSLYDDFGAGFTLLVLDAATSDEVPDDAKALLRDAAARGIPLEVRAPQIAGLRELYGAERALIRPDQHVAWRGNRCAPDATVLLDRVTGVVPSTAGAASATAPAVR